MGGLVSTIGGSGRLDLFYLDPGFGMKQRRWDGTQWTADWTRLGGTFTSAPAAVASMVRPAPVADPGTGGPARHSPIRPGVPGATPPAGAAEAPRDETGAGGSATRTMSSAAFDPGHGGFLPIPMIQRLDVFGLGLDYAMYHKALLGLPADNVGPWQNLGGSFTSAPAAIALDGQVHVFGLGTDYSMFHRTWNGSAWIGDWERLGGFFSSAASVVSWGPGRMDVFARGADFTLRHRAWEGGAWKTDWQNLGGSLASPPVAVSWGPNRLDVLAIGHDDGAVIHTWWDGDIWNQWEHVAGTKDLAFTSTPAAATWGENRLDVFATGSDGGLYHVWSTDQAWSTPESLGGNIASTPTVLAPAALQLDLVAPGTDGNLYHKRWDGAGWQQAGWELLGDRLRLPSQYTFSVDHMRVDTARSLDNDTDKGQCSLAIGNWPTTLTPANWPLLTRTQEQGDLGGTAIKEGPTNLMNFGPVTVELCEASIFNYTFVNSSKDMSEVNSILVQQGTKLADSGVQTAVKDIGAGLGITVVDVAGASAPIIGSLLAALGGWLASQLNSIMDGRCDGTVAAEQVVTMGRDLQARTIGGHPYGMTTIHDGSNSPVGCGSNSVYEVTWSITAK